MKKTLIILFCLPLISFAQDRSFELGFLFGGSLNSLSGSGYYSKQFPEKSLKYTGGVLAQYNFTNHFSIKSKLLYQIKGAGGPLEYTTDSFDDYVDNQINLHYATLPLVVQFNLRKNRWGFFCNTGVYLGYLIKGEIEEQKTEGLNKLDFGVVLGCGASFQINKRLRVFIEPSLGRGLTNISKTEPTRSVILSTFSSSLGLTYIFPIKNKTFNGTSTLDCADYDESSLLKPKKKSKWRLVLYKDGEKILGKKKKGKSRLFKKKD